VADLINLNTKGSTFALYPLDFAPKQKLEFRIYCFMSQS